MVNIFGKKLKCLREKRGMKQAELGNFLNYGSTAISNYEKGRNEPSMSDLCKLADFFDVSVDFMIGREERKSETDEMFKTLDTDELRFLDIYKSLDRDNKAMLRKFAVFLKSDIKQATSKADLT